MEIMTSYYLAKIRKRLLETEGYYCKACECKVHDEYGVDRNSPTKAHADHIVALANGGNNDLFNFQILCRKCNLRKGKMQDEEFKALIRAEQAYVKQNQKKIEEIRQRYKNKCSCCNELVPQVFTNNLCRECYQRACRRRSYQKAKERRMKNRSKNFD
ncbi:HNH endonuclease signature motif containing protein [Priestia megaterium]|uniref:HNH endonuclease n=1 Tax=Priestia megaterium TaxID=1404 RepID=UPI003459EC9F